MITFDYRDIFICWRLYEVLLLKDAYESVLLEESIVKYLNRFISLTITEYRRELLQFNGHIIDNKTTFCTIKDITNAINYLNEKYIVLINMIGNGL